MVLSKGELLQFDTPANLLRDEAGYFVSIAAHSAKCLWWRCTSACMLLTLVDMRAAALGDNDFLTDDTNVTGKDGS